MSSFKLTIVCPDGCLYDGEADFIKLRTTDGDVGILAHHVKYAAAIGMGECAVQMGDKRRTAACIGGMVTVADNEVNVISTSFEWKEDIDVERAKRSFALAEERLADESLNIAEKQLFEARRKRALVRISVASN